MRIRKNILQALSALLVLAALASCAMPGATGRVLYQQGRTFVRLEADPDVGGLLGGTPNTHPAAIESAELGKLLQGIGIQSEPVFNIGDLALLAPFLASGLAEAGPSERVAFSLARTQSGRRTGALSGYLSIQNPYMKFVLADHPTVGWQDSADPSSSQVFELEFLREGFLRPGSQEDRKGSFKSHPAIQIDYKNYLRALEGGDVMSKAAAEPPAAPAAPPPAQSPVLPAPSVEAGRPPSRRLPPPLPAAGAADTKVVADLQRQVKELTDVNEELRATLKDMLERQEKTQRELGELNRLRQELAETKQLLAGKVLELDKLKSKLSKSP